MVTSWGGLVMMLVLACIGGALYMQVRRRKRVLPKANWLIVEATVQPGGLGTISVGRYGTYAACFLGYAYPVEADGVRRAGYFALYGDEGTVGMVYKDLVGSSVKVQYDPNDPDASALLYSGDARFQGLKVTQDPALLAQAPSFDLKDVMGS